ncbi:MAG: ISAs1 family transposase [Planctomycetota bacterium]|nr:ISAs1 family transposase [Planctomycetota bacterium]
MAKATRIGLDEVICHFAALEDPRSEINLRHPLASVVVIALMAVLAGAGGPTAIAKWALMNAELLRGLLPLPQGIPRKDVFRRVLATLQPEAFQACYKNWLASLRDKAAATTRIDQPVLAIDGKTSRRSHDRSKGLGALHAVSVWASEYGLSLGQVATEEKSNEITAIPVLLTLVDIRGAIITIDAMGTQTAIAKQIIDGKADYVLALKGNQETLHDAVIAYVNEQLETDFANCGARRHVTKEKGHGREEIRHYVHMPVPQNLVGASRWQGLLTIGVAMLTCLREGKETMDVRYFISSLPLGVQRFAHAVRAHWGIENTCHWSLDITYREDESRIREKHLRENFAWLNRFTLSLLKQHPGKDSLIMKRRCCGWNNDFLLQTLTGSGS